MREASHVKSERSCRNRALPKSNQQILDISREGSIINKDVRIKDTDRSISYTEGSIKNTDVRLKDTAGSINNTGVRMKDTGGSI